MYGVYQTFYKSDFLSSQSESNISWIGSIQSFLLLVVGALAGTFYDAGYLRALLCIGVFLSVFGMMMTSICTTYWQVILAHGVVVGFGFGCLFVASLAVVSQYFTTKKAFATGIASTGSSIGEWAVSLPTKIKSDDKGYRRRHLSHHLLSIATSYWVRLGDSCNCLHYAWHVSRRTARYATKIPCFYTSGDIRSQGSERPTFLCLLSRTILRFHGHLHCILLHRNLCFNRISHGHQSYLLSPPHHQRDLYSWSSPTQFLRRQNWSTEYPDPFCFDRGVAMLLLD